MSLKIHAFALLFALMAPMSLAMLWLNWDIALMQNTVEERIEKEENPRELVTLTFTISESQTLLDWEHEREFEYQGQMYDVVEIHENGDQISYVVWPDHEETKLKRLLGELLDWDLEENEESESISQHFQLFSSKSSLEIQISKLVTRPEKFPTFQKSYYSLALCPPSPPPIRF